MRRMTSGRSCILVATSRRHRQGRALQGFADVPGTKILVFYPYSGVSEIQRLQMVTQTGNNVAVSAVRGNFDDAQTGVKQIFGDKAFARIELSQRGWFLSSANSINWGRLAAADRLLFLGILRCRQRRHDRNGR
ncbi:MAG: hypothetical protein ACLUNO_11320 [Oscillospiraceae bacterium]